eukprot:Colp12_sorted_trinity150504_noHs@10030
MDSEVERFDKVQQQHGKASGDSLVRTIAEQKHVMKQRQDEFFEKQQQLQRRLDDQRSAFQRKLQAKQTQYRNQITASIQGLKEKNLHGRLLDWASSLTSPQVSPDPVSAPPAPMELKPVGKPEGGGATSPSRKFVSPTSRWQGMGHTSVMTNKNTHTVRRHQTRPTSDILNMVYANTSPAVPPLMPSLSEPLLSDADPLQPLPTTTTSAGSSHSDLAGHRPGHGPSRRTSTSSECSSNSNLLDSTTVEESLLLPPPSIPMPASVTASPAMQGRQRPSAGLDTKALVDEFMRLTTHTEEVKGAKASGAAGAEWYEELSEVGMSVQKEDGGP